MKSSVRQISIDLINARTKAEISLLAAKKKTGGALRVKAPRSASNTSSTSDPFSVAALTFDSPVTVQLATDDAGVIYDQQFLSSDDQREVFLRNVQGLALTRMTPSKSPEYWSCALQTGRKSPLSGVSEGAPSNKTIPTILATRESHKGFFEISDRILDTLSKQVNSSETSVWQKSPGFAKEFELEHIVVNYYPQTGAPHNSSEGCGYRKVVGDMKDDWSIVAVVSVGIPRVFKLGRPYDMGSEMSLPSFVMFDGSLFAMLGANAQLEYGYGFAKISIDKEEESFGTWLSCTFRYKFSGKPRELTTNPSSGWSSFEERKTKRAILVANSKGNNGYWAQNFPFSYKAFSSRGKLINGKIYPKGGKVNDDGDDDDEDNDAEEEANENRGRIVRIPESEARDDVDEIPPLSSSPSSPSLSSSSSSSSSSTIPRKRSSSRPRSQSSSLATTASSSSSSSQQTQFIVDDVTYSIDLGDC